MNPLRLEGRAVPERDKIAVLLPVFNAGILLDQSIASIAASGLLPESYEILVRDNGSDDGSIERLPAQDAQGAPIHLRRNRANLGRVQNWNLALNDAEEMGFGFAIFLMAGDLINGDAVIALRQRMRETGAALGLGSYEIVDTDLRPLRVARRIVWKAKAAVPAQRFLAQSFAIGGMLLAPLGANLYDICGPSLRFDPDDPTHTDQNATARFLLASGRPVIYLDRPLMRWRDRPARFHNSMGLMQKLAGDRDLALRTCRQAGIAARPREIRCTFLLRIIFHARGNIFAAWRNLQSLASNNAPINWTFLLTMLSRRLIYGTAWRIAD